jgi:uncharacterized repeat protein (TIGR01451 family)
MKRSLALFLIAVMALSVVSAAGAVSAAPTPPPAKLKAPALLAPADKAKLPSGTDVQLQWKAVTGAVSYSVEVQLSTGKDAWTTVLSTNPTGTSATFAPPNDGTYRWRVQAVSSTPTLNSGWSPWRTFTVGTPTPTPPATKLKAPVLVSPADHASFTTTTAITFTWKAVTGATGYTIELQQQDAKWKWQPYPSGTLSVQEPTAKQTVPVAGTYRWHVQAVASTPTLNSGWSPWRTFTVTGAAPLKPGLSVTLTSDAQEPVKAGDSFTYTYTVKNTGEVTMSLVSVSDSAGAVSIGGTLQPGESFSTTKSYTVTADDGTRGYVDNTATVSGQTPTGQPVTATSDPLRVTTVPAMQPLTAKLTVTLKDDSVYWDMSDAQVVWSGGSGHITSWQTSIPCYGGRGTGSGGTGDSYNPIPLSISVVKNAVSGRPISFTVLITDSAGNIATDTVYF